MIDNLNKLAAQILEENKTPMWVYNYLVRAVEESKKFAEFNFSPKNRTVKVTNINDNIISFNEEWFLLDDRIINERTRNAYTVDFASGELVGVIGEDEFVHKGYDIRVNDLFYIEQRH